MSAVEAEVYAWLEELHRAIDEQGLLDQQGITERRTLNRHRPTVVDGETVLCTVCKDVEDSLYYPCPDVLAIAESYGLDGGA